MRDFKPTAAIGIFFFLTMEVRWERKNYVISETDTHHLSPAKSRFLDISKRLLETNHVQPTYIHLFENLDSLILLSGYRWHHIC